MIDSSQQKLAIKFTKDVGIAEKEAQLLHDLGQLGNCPNVIPLLEDFIPDSPYKMALVFPLYSMTSISFVEKFGKEHIPEFLRQLLKVTTSE